MTETDFTSSTAPADVVRRQYLASAAGDLAALRATLAPDVEWTEMAGFPLAGTYRTPEGVTANVMETWYLLPAKSLASVKNGENAIVSGLRIVAVSRSLSPERGCSSNGTSL